MTRHRFRGFDGREQAHPSREDAQSEDWVGKWPMKQLLITISTRKYQRSMRLPRGGASAPKGAGLSNRRPPGILSTVGGAAKGSDESDLSVLNLSLIQMTAFTWTRT